MDTSETSNITTSASLRKMQPNCRPAPLKVRKDSYKIKKPSEEQQQQLQKKKMKKTRPHAPRVFYTNPSEFRALVQLLTGMDSSSPIEKAAMLPSPEQQKPQQQQQQQEEYEWSLEQEDMVMGPVRKGLSVCSEIPSPGPSSLLLPVDVVADALFVNWVNQNCRLGRQKDEPLDEPLPIRDVFLENLKRGGNENVSQPILMDEPDTVPLIGQQAQSSPSPYQSRKLPGLPITSQGMQLQSNSLSSLKSCATKLRSSRMLDINLAVTAASSCSPSSQGLVSISDKLTSKDSSQVQTSTKPPFDSTRREGNPFVFASGNKVSFTFGLGSRLRNENPRAGWCKLRAVLKWWLVWKNVTAKRCQSIEQLSTLQEQGNPSIFDSGNDGYCFAFSPYPSQSKTGKSRAGWCKLRAVIKWWTVWRAVSSKRPQSMQTQSSLQQPSIISACNEGDSCSISPLQTHSRSRKPKAGWCKLRAVLKWLSVWRDVRYQSSLWEQGNTSKLVSGNEADSFIISSVESQSVTGKSKARWCKLRSVLAWWSHWRDVTVRRHQQMGRWNSLLQQGNASIFSSVNGWDSCVASHLPNNSKTGKPKAGWCKLRAVLKWWSIWRDVTAKKPLKMEHHNSAGSLENFSIFTSGGKGHLVGTSSLCQSIGVHRSRIVKTESQWFKPVAALWNDPAQEVQWTEKAGLGSMKMEQDPTLDKTNVSSKIDVLPCGISPVQSLEGKSIELNSGPLHPPKSLPPNFHPVYLVELNLRHSSIHQLWEGKQPFVNLESMDLNHSKVTRIPDLSEAYKLCRLNLQYCTNLVETSSIQDISKLEFLNLKGCKSLQSIPSTNDLKLLTTLILSECSSLKQLPDLSRSIEHLYLAGTAIEELPRSIGCLSSLIKLDLRNCSMLKNLPSSICDLQCLEYLNIAGCSILLKLLECISFDAGDVKRALWS